ncbi:peptidase C14 caspase catalytic subunit p20, partial [Candidatus Magnetobacterium bavaricum]
MRTNYPCLCHGEVDISIRDVGNGVLGAVCEFGDSFRHITGQSLHLDREVFQVGALIFHPFASNGYSEGRKKTRVTFTPNVLPTLWILSIGVNQYDNKQIPPLNYADSDATAIVEAFERQKGKLFREVNSLIISDHSNIKPTYDNISNNLNYLTTKAASNDVVLLFVSGHSVNDAGGAYYFLPSDVAVDDDGSINLSRAISGATLKSALNTASKKLVFADTCHFEEIGYKKTGCADNDGFVRDLKDANTIIFTSGKGREVSYESGKWKHGVFTYVIIKRMEGHGIETEGIVNENLTVTITELETYLSRKVALFTNGAQHPIAHIPEGYVNFPVAEVEL